MLTGKGIVTGLLRVLGVGMRPPVTYNYPEHPRPVAPRFRGMVGMRRDQVTGQLSCVGCGLCETACPNDVIRIDTSEAEDGTRWVERYQFDLGRCLVCYLCVEACPVDALQPTRAYHLSVFDRNELLITAEEMMRMTENPDMPLSEHLYRD